MDKASLDVFRQRLIDDLAALEEGDALGADARRTVELDQQSVGRLSRMDALQMQAMADATQRRRGVQRMRLRAALSRIESGEFGYCEDCGERIAARRLELDPGVTKCVGCA